MFKEKRVKLSCGGFVVVSNSILKAGGSFICSKGHEHPVKEIRAKIVKKK